MASTYDFDFVNKLGEADSCKKAIIVIAFFSYLVYCAIIAGTYFLEYKKMDEKLIKALKDFKLEIE